MKPDTVARWVGETVNAPPPPATPSCLPDDTVSTVYPESSVSNPYASRYTGFRHRAPPISRGSYPPPSYRPTSAQGHHRERLHPISQPPPPLPPRHRSRSYSAEPRHAPPAPHSLNPSAYTYAPPKPLVKPPLPIAVPPVYYAPSPIVSSSQSRSPSRGTTPSRNASRSPAPTTGATTQYRVTSPVPRGDLHSKPPPKDTRQYVSYGTYHSAPILSPSPHQMPQQKKPHILRRIFDWGTPSKFVGLPSNSSRSSSKAKSQSRSSDHDSNGRPANTTRKRSQSDNIIYLRY